VSAASFYVPGTRITPRKLLPKISQLSSTHCLPLRSTYWLYVIWGMPVSRCQIHIKGVPATSGYLPFYIAPKWPHCWRGQDSGWCEDDVWSEWDCDWDLWDDGFADWELVKIKINQNCVHKILGVVSVKGDWLWWPRSLRGKLVIELHVGVTKDIGIWCSLLCSCSFCHINSNMLSLEDGRSVGAFWLVLGQHRPVVCISPSRVCPPLTMQPSQKGHGFEPPG
jgi:hypothetical protein